MQPKDQSTPVIRFKQVNKDYIVNGKKIKALSNIDLDIPAGEIFGIIGRSGAGKSTLLKLINLLEYPSSGLISINGVSTATVYKGNLRHLRQKTGMVFQHFNLLNAKTVWQNIAFPLQIAGQLKQQAINQRVNQLIARVGLSEHTHKYPRQLSGGQKQRVGIARALACQPSILICDEATSALDPETTHSILKLLAELNQELGLTIVLITHEMDIVRQICHQVAVVDKGSIVETGKVEQVFLHPQHPSTYSLVSELEQHLAPPLESHLAESIYRFTFLGKLTHQPLLSELARRFGIDYYIVAGRIGTIRNLSYAQLTIGLSGESIQAALQYLREQGVHIEAVNQVPPIISHPNSVSSSQHTTTTTTTTTSTFPVYGGVYAV